MLGEIYLCTAEFPSAVRQFHFTEGLDHEKELASHSVDFGNHSIIIPSCPVPQRLERLQVSPNVIRYVPNQYQRFYVQLNGTFDEYLKRFSGDSRYKFLRKVKKFREIAKSDEPWREYRSRTEMAEFLHLAETISQKTYQDRLLGAGLPSTSEFREKTLDAADRDESRGYLLFLDGRAISFVLASAEKFILIQEFMGYDPEYRNLAPGTVLHYFVLQSIFKDRFKIFDFERGEAEYKQSFSTASQLCADVCYFPNTFRNRLLLSAHDSLFSFSRLMVRVLERFNLKTRVKNLIRSKA
jgi:CelD/BcsL family acetyltransferase involved in cellulose biosynthesis